MKKKRLDTYRLSGATWSWIIEFLYERRQKVVINGESSSCNDVISGNPVLGSGNSIIRLVNKRPPGIKYKARYIFSPMIRANKFQQDLVELHLWTKNCCYPSTQTNVY